MNFPFLFLSLRMLEYLLGCYDLSFDLEKFKILFFE